MWSDGMIVFLRQFINDTEPNPTYSDNRLEELLITSAACVLVDTAFSTNYIVSSISTSITPDPSSDNNFMVLVALKAAEIILRGEAKIASEASLVVRDGPFNIDATEKAKAKLELAKEAEKRFAYAKRRYDMGIGAGGVAIVGPYGGVSTSYETPFI